MASVLSEPHFHDEEAAYRFVEAKVWPNGPICPRCQTGDRVTMLHGKSTRIGTYKCNACRKPFTVKIGTIFEASHVPMNIWLQAIHLLCAGKKGISANELGRLLNVQVRTAWFMAHRIREAMRPTKHPQISGDGKAVEADETFFGRKKDRAKRRGYGHKHAVLSLIERGGKC
ncbi:MAG: IS1595 family transposase [Methyloceanibacter sp.]